MDVQTLLYPSAVVFYFVDFFGREEWNLETFLEEYIFYVWYLKYFYE